MRSFKGQPPVRKYLPVLETTRKKPAIAFLITAVIRMKFPLTKIHWMHELPGQLMVAASQMLRFILTLMFSLPMYPYLKLEERFMQ